MMFLLNTTKVYKKSISSKYFQFLLHAAQRFANMARSRLFAGFLLII